MTTASRSLRTLKNSLPCNICGGGVSSSLGQVRYYATPITASSSSSRSAQSNSSASSSTSGGTGIPNPSAYAVFDRATKIKQKNRAVRRDIEHSRLTDYVKDEVAANLVERLLVRAS